MSLFDMFTVFNKRRGLKESSTLKPEDRVRIQFEKNNIKDSMDVNQKLEPITGWYSIHHFVAAGDLETVEWLIEKGADLNKKDRIGKTALHYASHEPDKEMLLTLILSGADERLRCNAGLTPFDEAKEYSQGALYKSTSFEAKQITDNDGYYAWKAQKDQRKVLKRLSWSPTLIHIKKEDK